MDDVERGTKQDNSGSFTRITAGQFWVRIDPTANGGEAAEVSITQKFSKRGPPFDVELHYVLFRRDSGFYNYAVFDHPQGYPAGKLSSARMLFRLSGDVFDFMTVDDRRRRYMPEPNTPHKTLGPKESRMMTSGPFQGLVENKYHSYADAGEHFFHCWTGSKSGIGFWILYGSTENQNVGPTKRHITAHFPHAIMKILTCSHYGAAPVTVGTEQWQKIYGPWMVYINARGDKDQLWMDSKHKSSSEQDAWPYAWMRHPLYPLASERGTVRGRLNLSDTQDPKASLSSAWVGLAAPQPDWQQQSNGYQNWVRAGKDGSFTIPHVRADNYTLYAFVDGVMDEFRCDDLSIAKNQVTDLDTLEWKPIHYGGQLWQIGTPDRTAKEFRHGDDYRQGGNPSKVSIGVSSRRAVCHR